MIQSHYAHCFVVFSSFLSFSRSWCLFFFLFSGYLEFNDLNVKWKRISLFLVNELSQNDPVLKRAKEKKRSKVIQLHRKMNVWITIDSKMVKFYGYSLVMTLRTAPHLASLCFYYLLIMVFHFKHNYMSLYLMVNLSKNHFRPGSLFRSKWTNTSIVLICQVQRLELCRIPHNKSQWKKKQIHVWYLKRRSMFV